MAPRKSDATGHPLSAAQSQQDASSEGIEDFEFPRMLVTQLAKSALPPDIKLDDDTITVLVKGSTVFINHLTSAAQEIAASRAHKTISGADVLKALENLEFGDLVPAFQGDLETFRQGQKVDKTKTKITPETKGKGKEKDPPTKPAVSQPDVVTASFDVTNAAEFHLPEQSNALSMLDVDMRDMSEKRASNDEVKGTVGFE